MHILGMTLDEYLTDKKIGEAEFGARIGRNQSTINRLRRGQTKPDWPTIVSIAKATGDAVSADDFMPTKDDKPSGQAEPLKPEAVE